MEKRQSFPIKIEQLIKEDVEKSNEGKVADKPAKEKRGRGRPKGSKNKDKIQVNLRASASQTLLTKGFI